MRYQSSVISDQYLAMRKGSHARLITDHRLLITGSTASDGGAHA
jgi:hypothetical protein